ncbi:Lipase Member I [Manis pentadactyla]|nr:Lipase Member I [Manis pentadactyla]
MTIAKFKACRYLQDLKEKNNDTTFTHLQENQQALELSKDRVDIEQSNLRCSVCPYQRRTVQCAFLLNMKRKEKNKQPSDPLMASGQWFEDVFLAGLAGRTSALGMRSRPLTVRQRSLEGDGRIAARRPRKEDKEPVTATGISAKESVRQGKTAASMEVTG